MKVATFCSHFENDWPPMADIRKAFRSYSEDEWANAGEGQSFWLYGAEGTESLEPFNGRIDINLEVYDFQGRGVILIYTKSGGSSGECWYSSGDTRQINLFVETRQGHPLSAGCIIPFAEALMAVEDFVTSEGKKSNRIGWVAADDLPDPFINE